MISWLKNVAIVCLALLAPVKTIMLASFVLIMIDLVTGLWRALKAKEPVTSNGLRRTVTKVAAYELAILAAFLMEHFLLGDSVPIIKLVASLIALTEGKSVMENISEITGVDFVKMVMDKIQGGEKPE